MTRWTPAELLQRWRNTVNALPETLDEWLTTPESAAVGTRAPGAAHSVGQLSGMRIVEMLQTPTDDWNDSDWAHARRTIGYVRRHRAQWPSGDLSTRRWTYSLRNWGHDPLWWGRLGPTELCDGERVLRVDSEEVGLLALTVTEDTVLVDRLELIPEWRGRGVGSAVLQELSRASGRRLEVDLLGGEVASTEFFERRGFGVVDSGTDHSHLVRPRYGR